MCVCVHAEMQTLASVEKCRELEVQYSPHKPPISNTHTHTHTHQDTIRWQPMSAKDARDLRQSISDAEHEVEKHRQMQSESMTRIEELQMQHNRYSTYTHTHF